ncbi:C-C motif chemokine 19-like [Cololabis saira]|uniref:C-C motif chemokine 19-like n=1 Tax=Cololabis saira TaxID=129043 RepID=UPI002AD3D3C0|nr:C-C motif chemokine 19-like [Cololabis saira]
MASRLSALFFLGVICLGLVSAEIAVDCCLQVSGKRLPFKNIVRYIIQDAGKGCDISATVFTMKNGQNLCAEHPSANKWVKTTIQRLDKRQ